MKKIIFLGILCLSVCTGLKAQIITTIIGNGTAGYTGDGGPASAAELRSPVGVSVDDSNNIFILDQGNKCVRKINTNGIISTYASGFTSPNGIGVDDTGNVFVASGVQVFKVNKKGVISVYAGNGYTGGYAGDGTPATGALATINKPVGVCADDSGNIYITDQTGFRVFKVNTKGIINTIAGHGYNGSSGDGGYATDATFGSLAQVMVDDSFNVYISDNGDDQIRVVNTQGVISEVAGTLTGGIFGGDGGPATACDLAYPWGMVKDSAGNIYIADQTNSRIRVINTAGIIQTIAGSGNGTAQYGYTGDGGPATAAKLNGIYQIAMDHSGDLLIADSFNERIRKITKPIAPVAYFKAVDTVMCSADSIGFKDTSAYYPNSWLWSFPGGWPATSTLQNPYVHYPSSGTYTVTLYESNLRGADSITKTVNIIVNPTPTVTISGKDTICQGVSTTLTATGGSIYKWATGATTSSIMLKPGGTGTYTLSVSNGVCVKDTSVVVHVNAIPYINITTPKGNICLGTSTQLIATSGPVNYTWAPAVSLNKTTGDTVTASPSVTTTYTIIGTNTSGCIDSTHFQVNVSVPDSLVMVIEKDSVCQYAPDTIKLVGKASAGTTYQWSIGGNTPIIVDAPWATTTYTVVVHNGGCKNDTLTGVVNVIGGFPLVSITSKLGTVCTGGPDVLVATGATKYTWSPSASLSASTGDTVIASPTVTTTYSVEGINISTCGNDTSILTMVVVVDSGHGFDLTGNLSVCVDTPGFNSASIQACIFNDRCQIINGKLKLVMDTAIHITKTIADSAAHISGDTLIWNYNNLAGFTSAQCVTLTGTVSNIPKGDSVFVSMFITPVAGDSVPSNNSVTYWIKPFPYNCVGIPFDPNEKSVLPEGDIQVNQQLTYTIHFQNTGTATANNVVVVDTLSPYLDPTTLKVIASSHDEVTSISSGNIVKFTLNNIALPDTDVSRTASIGVVKYTISPLSSDVGGDVIKNTAGIYFDANPVVKTNTAISKIAINDVSVENITASMLNIACFPNPFTSSTSIVFNTDGKHYLEVEDVTGRNIEKIECTGKQYELSGNNLAKGVYFIKAYNADKSNVAVTKVVLQ